MLSEKFKKFNAKFEQSNFQQYEKVQPSTSRSNQNFESIEIQPAKYGVKMTIDSDRTLTQH